MTGGDVRDGLTVMASHYGHALMGVGCRLDLDEDANPGNGLWALGSAVAILLLAVYGDLRCVVGGLFLLCSPSWARALLYRPDRVIEWRGYTAIVGVALVGGDLMPYWMIGVIVLVFAVLATRRALFFRSELAFRSQAVVESPSKWRAVGDYANALASQGRYAEAAREYAAVIAQGGVSERETAQANLDGMTAAIAAHPGRALAAGLDERGARV